MNIHTKINIKNNPLCWLNWNQYIQLLDRNLLSLAPYYFDRLKRQGKEVEEAENFKSIYGCYRFEYENR